MSVDKLVDSTQLDSDLTSVANAIRTKGGTSAALAFPADFLTAIANIPSGGSVPRLIDQLDITFATTATNSNKLSVTLTPITNGLVIVLLDTVPASPHSSEYIALAWGQAYTSYGTNSNANLNPILRPAGTIGTDTAMCSFNTGTGVLQIGGSYGHFLAGTTYHVYEFEMGAA